MRVQIGTKVAESIINQFDLTVYKTITPFEGELYSIHYNFNTTSIQPVDSILECAVKKSKEGIEIIHAYLKITMDSFGLDKIRNYNEMVEKYNFYKYMTDKLSRIVGKELYIDECSRLLFMRTFCDKNIFFDSDKKVSNQTRFLGEEEYYLVYKITDDAKLKVENNKHVELHLRASNQHKESFYCGCLYYTLCGEYFIKVPFFIKE